MTTTPVTHPATHPATHPVEPSTTPALVALEITSPFWVRYRDLVVDEVLPYQWRVMTDEADIEIAHEPGGNEASYASSHAVANFEIAAGRASGRHSGYVFQDTDVYKWLEAVAYALRYRPDAAHLRRLADSVVELVAAAQEPDGYLCTFFQIEAPERRFARLRESHELYTMGHGIEALVAYHEVTGDERALRVAVAMADCLDRAFGRGPGQLRGYDGHAEVELALARLHEATGEDRYLALARFFLTERGQDPEFFDRQVAEDGPERSLIDGMHAFDRAYFQAAEPVTEMATADGHAVRLAYLVTGMAQVGRLADDPELSASAERLWHNVTRRRMYVTGAVGSAQHGERFTTDHDLPNDTVYGETCASVGMAFLGRALLRARPDGEFADVVERELFNSAVSGMSQDGTTFFYVNPLEADPAWHANPGLAHVLTRRADWFGCACCPSNVARLVASVDQYVYSATDDDTVLVSQYIASEATFDGGVRISQASQLPWGGTVRLDVANPDGRRLRLGVRIPQWSAGAYRLVVDGVPCDEQPRDGYVFVDVSAPSTVVSLELDMTPTLVQADDRVRADVGKVAVTRGPVVYCAEGADNVAPLWLYRVGLDAEPVYRFDELLLGGMGRLSLPARRRVPDGDDASLYRPARRARWEDATLELVPYFAWANRSEGPMSVWVDAED
ncbi:glycoside hydrolase family 127 protein [Isoptericola sp. NPDC057191]|uniref:glycoside hydrolase family 127 protein n=1 Tax=Isoptericola sp. NPDC057191 TaxID=3346041 RepID=UPI003641981D